MSTNLGRNVRVLDARLLLVLMIAVMTLTLGVQSARAGVITGQTSTYVFTAANDSNANDIEVTYVSPTTIKIKDLVEPLTESSSNCVVAGTAVTCTVNSSGSTVFKWILGSTDDNITIDDAVNTKDTVDAGFGADTLYCGGGTDVVDYSTRTSSVNVTPSDVDSNDGEIGEFDYVLPTCEGSTGGSGPDVLQGSDSGAATILGNDGNDRIIGSLGNTDENCGDFNTHTYPSQLFGGNGDDIIQGLAGTNWIKGGAGDDIMTGAETCDLMMGYGGSDTYVGGDGADWLYDFHENVFGSRNTMVGGAGDDDLWGGIGDDTIIASSDGGDNYTCGYGNDTVVNDASDMALIDREPSGTTADCERTSY